jgi:hypothetical protein
LQKSSTDNSFIISEVNKLSNLLLKSKDDNKKIKHEIKNYKKLYEDSIKNKQKES